MSLDDDDEEESTARLSLTRASSLLPRLLPQRPPETPAGRAEEILHTRSGQLAHLRPRAEAPRGVVSAYCHRADTQAVRGAAGVQACSRQEVLVVTGDWRLLRRGRCNTQAPVASHFEIVVTRLIHITCICARAARGCALRLSSPDTSDSCAGPSPRCAPCQCTSWRRRQQERCTPRKSSRRPSRRRWAPW